MKKFNKGIVSVLAMGVLMVGLSGCQRGDDANGGAASSGSSGMSGTGGASGTGTGAGGAGGTSGTQR